jgi:hypothetical protein
MTEHRTVLQRIVLGVMWGATSLGAIGGLGYAAASVWLERNTILVHVIDCDGHPVANAKVSKFPLANLAS